MNPQLHNAYVNLARVQQESRQYAAALATFRQIQQRWPQDLVSQQAMCWLLATAPDDDVRSGKEAATLARELAQQGQAETSPLQYLLAAALAESGEFEQAIDHARLALQSAQRDKNSTLAKQIQQHLRRYEQRQPLRLAP